MNRYGHAPNWTFLVLGLPILAMGIFYLVRGITASRRMEPSVRIYAGPAAALGSRGYVPTRMAIMLGVVSTGLGVLFALGTVAFR